MLRYGQIEFIDKFLVRINSFIQFDFVFWKVVYNNLNKGDNIEDLFKFIVINGFSQVKEGDFRIFIELFDCVFFLFIVNILIEVIQGGEVELFFLLLKVQDLDIIDFSVMFIIVKFLIYGCFYNNGIIIIRFFIQSDINLGFIMYRIDGFYVGLDNFFFNIFDGKYLGFLVNRIFQIKFVICSIFIKLLVNDVLKLFMLKQFDILEYFGNDWYGF